MKGFPDLPPIWLACALAVAWFAAGYVPLAQFSLGPVGSIVFWAGLIPILWAIFWFIRRETPVEPHHTPKVLLIEGPFRFSRNPIYLGLVMILTGAILGWGALSPLIVIPLFIWVIQKRFILPEETELRATFGDAAERYFEQTRRWL